MHFFLFSRSTQHRALAAVSPESVHSLDRNVDNIGLLCLIYLDRSCLEREVILWSYSTHRGTELDGKNLLRYSNITASSTQALKYSVNTHSNHLLDKGSDSLSLNA